MPPEQASPDLKRIPLPSTFVGPAEAPRLGTSHTCRNHLHLVIFPPVRHAKLLQVNVPAAIDGVLDDKELKLWIRTLDLGGTILQRTCVRLDSQELPSVGDIPEHTNLHCNISWGETCEGLNVVVELHRCYTTDPQHNAFVRKVRTDVHHRGCH